MGLYRSRWALLGLLVLPLACSQSSTSPSGFDEPGPPIPIDIPSPNESAFAELRDFTVVGYFSPPLSYPGDVRIELFLGETPTGAPLRLLRSYVDSLTGVTPRSALRFSYAQGIAWGPAGSVTDTTQFVMTPDLVAVPGGLLDPGNKVVVTHNYYAAVILGGVSRSFDTNYSDANGPWEDLSAGIYTLRVLGESGELAGRSDIRKVVFGRTHAMLGRFSPPEHKERLLAYAASRSLRTYVDFFPGFFSFEGYAYEIPGRWMPNNSVEVVNNMPNAVVDDVASAQNDLLLYNISVESATNRIEIGALAAHQLIDSARTIFHRYALGEPSLNYVDRDGGGPIELHGSIETFALGDQLELTRIEREDASRPLSEGVVEIGDDRPRTLHTEFTEAIPWAPGELFVVFGVVTPIPSATHPGAQPSQHVIENAITTIEYSFHVQTASSPALHSEVRAVGLERIFGSAHAFSVYEFEHEFEPAALGLTPGDYIVVLQCRDSQGRPLEGGRESLRLAVLAGAH